MEAEERKETIAFAIYLWIPGTGFLTSVPIPMLQMMHCYGVVHGGVRGRRLRGPEVCGEDREKTCERNGEVGDLTFLEWAMQRKTSSPPRRIGDAVVEIGLRACSPRVTCI
jgi:hypothetical protein